MDEVDTRVSAVASLFEENILSGVWGGGFKLPTERELERQFGIPRNKLRKVLKQFESSGRITRHVGRGSFVTAKDAASSPPTGTIEMRPTASIDWPDSEPAAGIALNELEACIRGASPDNIMEVRLMIEPAAAELAAVRATAQDLAQIESCHERSLTADSIPAFEYWDGLLHRKIVAAARNELLLSLYAAVSSARDQPEWAKMKERTVTPPRRQGYCDHHAEIVQALKERDGKRARELSTDHLRAVRNNFFGI